MQKDDNTTLHPPVGYEPMWVILAVLLIVAVIAWFVLVFWLTRKREPKPVLPPPKPDLAALKAKYLQLIADVERTHASGALVARGAHQKLSLLLRFFVFESSGVSAHVMTLSDIKATKLRSLESAIEMLYPAEFSQVSRGDVADAIQKSKELIAQWL